MSESLISIRHLKVELMSVQGLVYAVRDINLDIAPGEIHGIVGESGCGKSMTAKSILRLHDEKKMAYSGEILLDGESIMHMPARKRVSMGISQVPEARRIFPDMSVFENLEMGAFTQGGKSMDTDLERVYTQFPRLKERMKQVAGTLSGGEQQMLAMGRALMSHPKLLMLDEPSMGLAPILVEQIFDIIQELHKAGTTILLVEQNAQAALSVADRGYVLETGKVVTTGTGHELLESPAIKKAYLGG